MTTLARDTLRMKILSILLLSVTHNTASIMPRNYAREVELCSTDFALFHPCRQKIPPQLETQYFIA